MTAINNGAPSDGRTPAEKPWALALLCLSLGACGARAARPPAVPIAEARANPFATSSTERMPSKSELIEAGVLGGEPSTVESEGSKCAVKQSESGIEVSGELGPGAGAEAGLAFGLDVGFGQWAARRQFIFSVRRRAGPRTLKVRAISARVVPNASGDFDTKTVSLGEVVLSDTWSTVELAIPTGLRAEEREVSELDFVVSGSEKRFAFDVRDLRSPRPP